MFPFAMFTGTKSHRMNYFVNPNSLKQPAGFNTELRETQGKGRFYQAGSNNILLIKYVLPVNEQLC